MIKFLFCNTVGLILLINLSFANRYCLLNKTPYPLKISSVKQGGYDVNLLVYNFGRLCEIKNVEPNLKILPNEGVVMETWYAYNDSEMEPIILLQPMLKSKMELKITLSSSSINDTSTEMTELAVYQDNYEQFKEKNKNQSLLEFAERAQNIITITQRQP